MTNTNKIGYSVNDVCQILHCSVATVHRLIDDKEIECLITDPKTPGGRRQFRFLKEHIQHYMLKHYDKFEDITLQTWGGGHDTAEEVHSQCGYSSHPHRRLQ